MNLASVCVQQSYVGASSTHMVRQSTMLMIYLALEWWVGGLIGPTNLITQFSKGCITLTSFKGNSSLQKGLPT